MNQNITPFAHGLLIAARMTEAKALETGSDKLWKKANELFAKANAEILKQHAR